MCRDSVAGRATRYRLDGRVIEPRRVRDFSHHPHPGAHAASYTMGTWSLPVPKRSERGVKVKERVKLCL